MRTAQEIREYKRKWASLNKERLSIKRKRWEKENKEHLSHYHAEYQKKHKEKLALQSKEYYEKNKEKIKERSRQYSKNNRSSINLYKRKYDRDRRRSDPQFRLAIILRARLRKVLKSNAKVGSAVRDLGCTVTELKVYLEGKFKDGMSWGNYSKWHLDHEIPLSLFDLTDREQFLRACHYTNLQPLWALENIKKGNKRLN